MSIDSGTKIPVSFDPGSVTSAIQLWREATDMKMPLHDDFKIHFMKNRRKLLDGFERTANAMSMVLAGMTATDDAGAVELAKVRAELAAFSQWAKDGLRELNEL
jgi:hypothetical protein